MGPSPNPFSVVRLREHPRTADILRLDSGGYVLTGRDLSADDWPSHRQLLPFETSRPDVFAAGDVRHNLAKRVAGAVGEGSVTVASVHQYPDEIRTSVPRGSQV
jgi:thioredoxin reductase (NADPH)